MPHFTQEEASKFAQLEMMACGVLVNTNIQQVQGGYAITIDKRYLSPEGTIIGQIRDEHVCVAIGDLHRVISEAYPSPVMDEVAQQGEPAEYNEQAKYIPGVQPMPADYARGVDTQKSLLHEATKAPTSDRPLAPRDRGYRPRGFA